MWIRGGLAPRQHWRDTRVGAGEYLRPLVAGFAREARGENLEHPRIRTDIELTRHLVGGQPQSGEQFGEELRLDCAHGHVLTVGGLVAAIKRGPPSERKGS